MKKLIEKYTISRNQLLDNQSTSTIFLFLFTYFVVNLLMLIITFPIFMLTPEYDVYVIVAGIVSALIGLLVLYRFKCWFKDYDGVIKTNLSKAFALSLPLIAYVIINIFIFDTRNLSLLNVIRALSLSLQAGVVEEVIMRLLVIPNYIRLKNEGPSFIKIALITSIIFGLSHLANIMSNADVLTTIYQILSAFSLGMILAAILIRTGNGLLLIIYHTLINFIGFLDPNIQNSGGILQSPIKESVVCIGIGVSVIMLIYSLYLLRKAKHKDIIELWNKKWKKAL